MDDSACHGRSAVSVCIIRWMQLSMDALRVMLVVDEVRSVDVMRNISERS